MCSAISSRPRLDDLKKEARQLLHALHRRDAAASTNWLAWLNRDWTTLNTLSPESTSTAVGAGLSGKNVYRRWGVMDGRAMVAEAMRLRPDVIVVDVAMPLLNGLDAARKIAEQLHNIKFVFLTMRDDPNLAAAALELGPIGFVLKHSPGQELLKAIDYVLHGKPYLTPKLRAEDWVATKARARQFSTAMTPRQRSIVQLLAEGRPIKEIAGVLDISEKTVEFHKHHIREAFNLRSNADVVLFALKEGLISTNPKCPGGCNTARDSPSCLGNVARSKTRWGRICQMRFTGRVNR